MRERAWSAVVHGSGDIRFFNSIGGESGPWAYNPQGQTVFNEDYGYRKVSDRLAQMINKVLSAGLMPARLSYASEDIEGPRD